MNQSSSQIPKTSTMAIISLVTSLLFIPVVSIVLGHLARREVRKSNGTITGAGMALAGLIIGYIQVAVLMLIIIVTSSLALSSTSKIFGGHKDDAAQNWVNSTGEAYVTSYLTLSGEYPKSLNSLLAPKLGLPPFVKSTSDLNDPWGNQYQYKYPGVKNANSFDLWTVTPDGRTIGNW
tara:strand:- start:353 stop:886 length:534 start_codon:yes stop_codon:yes gene_type:complete